MIIDSKLPLTGYERLINAVDEVERIAASNQFIRDVKGHIDDLAGKRYQENTKIITHDCVLMFVPIEGALAAALTEEPDLFTYAWNRHVVLVGPPTLLMTMRTVASIWRYELQGQNAQEIARLAGELCDKVSMSLVDLNTVAERIQGPHGSQRGSQTARNRPRQRGLDWRSNPQPRRKDAAADAHDVAGRRADTSRDGRSNGGSEHRRVASSTANDETPGRQ